MQLNMKIVDVIAGVWCGNRYQLRKALQEAAAPYGGTPAQVQALIAMLDQETANGRAFKDRPSFNKWPGQLPPSWRTVWGDRHYKIAPWLHLLSYFYIGKAVSGYALSFGSRMPQNWHWRIANQIGSVLCVRGVEVRAMLLPRLASMCDWQDIDLTTVMEALHATFSDVSVFRPSTEWWESDRYESIYTADELVSCIVNKNDGYGACGTYLRVCYQDQQYLLQLGIGGVREVERLILGDVRVERDSCMIDNQTYGLQRLCLNFTIGSDWPVAADSDTAATLRLIAQQLRENLRDYNRGEPCIAREPV